MESMNEIDKYSSYNRMDDFLMDTLEGVETLDECLHTPDLLIYMGAKETNEGIVNLYKCTCGKQIEELYISDQ